MDKENSLKLPSSVVILGRKYKIIQKKKVIYQDKEILGLCDSANKRIYISKDQSEADKLETLYHECTHAMLNISGVNQTLTEFETEIVCQLVTALIDDLTSALGFSR